MKPTLKCKQRCQITIERYDRTAMFYVKLNQKRVNRTKPLKASVLIDYANDDDVVGIEIIFDAGAHCDQ